VHAPSVKHTKNADYMTRRVTGETLLDITLICVNAKPSGAGMIALQIPTRWRRCHHLISALRRCG
jgi:hypothetical protein